MLFLRILFYLMLVLLFAKGANIGRNVNNTTNSSPSLTNEVYCEFYDHNTCIKSQLNGGFEGCGEARSCGTTASPTRYSCFALLSNEDDHDNLSVSIKGCLRNVTSCYDKSHCTPKMQKELGLLFCCCEGNLCNRNVGSTKTKLAAELLPKDNDTRINYKQVALELIYEHAKYQPAVVKGVKAFTEINKILSRPTVDPDVPKTNDKTRTRTQDFVTVVYVLLFGWIGCASACIGIIVYIIVKHYRSKDKSQVTVKTNIQIKSKKDSCLDLVKIDVSLIHFIKEKNRGQFGTLWKALYENKPVAVKIFTKEDKKAWKHEINVFKPTIRYHPNIVQIIGIGQKPLNEYWLITEFYHIGSLHEYLINHTVSWKELRLIAETMTRGLACLHELDYTGSNKPMIAHRDFKSTSVLLKNDLTACISDFVSAVAFNNDAECGRKHYQSGTKRYMAPEVLEGAIVFRPTSFLRIDMYACALVLWELVSRCTAVCGPVLEYKLPYEEEVGKSPNLVEMQQCVLQRNVRPTIQEAWMNHPGLKEICTTIEDCWDYDYDARLTAACVLERIKALSRPHEKDYVVFEIIDGIAVVDETTPV